MITTKLYEYDSTQEANGYRGQDYSAHILIGDTIKDDLSEVMGTVELTLTGLTQKEEFAPKTKFILDKEDDTVIADGEPYRRTWHIVVQEDVVSQPILSDDNYFDHHISFTEPSACAQGYLVDNISVTYKLQDVTLAGETIINTNQTVDANFVPVNGKNPNNDNMKFFVKKDWYATEYSIGKSLSWDAATISDWQSKKYYVGIPEGSNSQRITLDVPMLEILNGVKDSKNFAHMGYCSVVTTVTEKNTLTGETNTDKIIIGTDPITEQPITTSQLVTNPNRNDPNEQWVNDWGLYDMSVTLNPEGRILEKIAYSHVGLGIYSNPISKVVANYVNTTENRTIQFDALPNCLYTVQTMLKTNFAYYSHGVAYNIVVNVIASNDSPTLYTNNGMPCATMQFMTYVQGETSNVYLKRAPETNAYDLFQKAQVNTQNVIKVPNVPITETPQTFYVSDQDKQELKNTKVVENFYNQKNWWEVLLEIGKYIHAIPKIKFGADDKFIVEWQKLGLTDQYQDDATKISIFNSRSIENYISACSSYVSNIVQLGGVIDEWVAPKSSSEDYLVYNDVAEIKTSKPIIEIVSMEAKCINNTYGINTNVFPDLTASLTPQNENGYVFEENVYNILAINWEQLVNKGRAIYYELGSNIIKGLNYQLPTINGGDWHNNYAIKNILGMIFKIGGSYGLNGEFIPNPSDWFNIRVNDFIFHIVYRTKGTARSDQTRPDLRKYLLNSKYDRIPQHNQFNNQQDILVDSEKFGNNIYGKLIRTGNSTYTKTEWIDSLIALKEVGQLYKINGEDYYVSTVKNVFYPSHIESEVVFSKDYNQLSEIIGIPSEPRFYEISEQSLINREVSLNSYVILGTKQTSDLGETYDFIRDYSGWEYLCDLLFRNEQDFPKFAITVFKNDTDRKYGDVTGNETFYKDVCHPISTYSIQNTLTMEWDMEDNFSAGDKVSANVTTPTAEVDAAYRTLLPVKYTDVYGRSDLLDFIIMRNLDGLNAGQIQSLPDSPLRTLFPNILAYGGNMQGSTLPSTQDLDAQVLSSLGAGHPKNGDAVTFLLTSDPNYPYRLYVYENDVWDTASVIDKYDYDLINSGNVEWDKQSVKDYNDKYLFGNQNLSNMGKHSRGLGLIKDNREKISLNYNVQMLADSDRFVLSSWLWQPRKGNLKLALLNKEINKISNDTIPQDDIITDEYIIHAPNPNNPSQYIDNAEEVRDCIFINISSLLNGVDLTDVKALAIVSDEVVANDFNSGARYFVMGRNITGLDTSDFSASDDHPEEKAKADWWINPCRTSMFEHQ